MSVVKEKKSKKDKKEKKEKKEKRVLEEVEESSPKKAKTSTATAEWLAEKHIKIDGAEIDPCVSFDMMPSLGFPKRLFKACKDSGFAAPTAIQAACWPLVMSQVDLCAIAKTGSGKTLGFLLPFLALSEKGTFERYEQPCAYPRMVCLAPTHELAMQIQEVAVKFGQACSKEGQPNKYPSVCIVGGVPKWQQKKQIQENGCDILIATPGRLQDLANEGTVSLESVKFFVLDEADRMLDQGFVMDVRRISEMMPKDRQTVCFSATWPASVHRLAREIMRNKPATITVGSKTDDSQCGGADQLRANEDIKQIVEVMENGRGKPDRLVQILREHKDQKVIIFALYKKEAAWLETFLQRKGFPNACAIQGNMTQEKRTQAIVDFKSGASNPLIATDVASRGLDVKAIDLVLNYTFPLTVEDYVHRVGRTGRGGAKGKSHTFFNIDGDHKEKEHAHGLLRVLETSKQEVPAALRELSGNTFCATKKKDHPIYGKFYKDEAEMAKLEAMKVHTTFDSDSD